MGSKANKAKFAFQGFSSTMNTFGKVEAWLGGNEITITRIIIVYKVAVKIKVVYTM